MDPKPASPASSSVSLRSDLSKENPPDFGNDVPRPASPASSSVSLRSDLSKENPPDFGNDVPRPASPASSSVSLRSDLSKENPPDFGNDVPRPASPASSSVSLRSDLSKENPPDFGNDVPSRSEPPGSRYQEDDCLNFIEDSPEQRLRRDGRKLILDMHEDVPSNTEKDSNLYNIFKNMSGKFQKPEVKPIRSYNDIFAMSDGEIARTVLMTGEAGVGKTFETKKFMVDWAKGNSNKNIDLIVPLHFNELNKMRDQEETMENLLNHFLKNIKKSEKSFCDCDLAFVLDGLENCQLPLKFKKNKKLTDVKEVASLDVLLMNLINGNLLPNARLWIISQPSGVNKIPNEYINKMMECRDNAKREFINQLKKKVLDQYENELRGLEEDSELYKMIGYKDVPQTYDDIFIDTKKKSVRTVLMTGEAGAGKTFQTRKFMVDWAKGNSNKSIDLIVPLHFDELNKIRDQEETMENLLNHFLKNIKKSEISFCDCNLAFVLDGLENCQLPLEFKNNKKLKDVTKPASLDVLLMNLINGSLLPNARLWIISQPSGVNKIPKEYINKMMKCRDDTKIRLIEKAKKRVLDQYENELRRLEEDSELYKMIGDKEEPQTYNNIFLHTEKKEVRTVLTKGVANVGKTFQTKKLMVDWAKGNSNKSIDLIIPLSLSKFEAKAEEVQSMKALLSHFLDDNKWNGRKDYISQCKLAFILDDLEKCKSPLAFEKNHCVTDIKESAPIDVLLTNLIKGDLLPEARLWINSQPAGTAKIPAELIHKETQCRETSKRRKELVLKLKERYRRDYTPFEDLNHPNQKNTEHILRERSTEDVKTDGQTMTKSVTRVSVSDIFKEGKDRKVRTVLTVGEANIGKSLQVQKFIKAWAENKTILSRMIDFGKKWFGKAEDVEVIFPIDLSKSDLQEAKTVSLVGLLNNLFEETKKYVISDYSKFKLVFLLDGLDAFRLPLEFDNEAILDDIRKPASVGFLLTNLIRGDLLPSARLWITSQPSAVEKLPAKCVDKKTEIREKPDIRSKRNLKSQLVRQLTYVPQGTDKGNTSAVLNEIYTDLYIIEGDRGDVNKKHEVRQVDDARSARKETPIKYSDIFKNTSVVNTPIKTVLTIGVAGIGKTFASMKYVLDWAECPADKTIDYTFLLPFRELNLRREKEHSFEELIHQLFPVMKNSEITDYDKYKILIVLDGLDECRLDLNFNENIDCTDVRKRTSVNVLMTNLIRGKLLPNAQIWITSRPAASNNIPPDVVTRVTEVRGFNENQKEEYFRKRFTKKELGEQVLSEVKKSRSLFIMCYIPIFCWITSNVMEDIMTKPQKDTLPKTLTYMYTRFLLQQCEQANVKYGKTEISENPEADSCWNTRNKETVLALGKLAFEELEKGNLLFTEEHLVECGINIENAAVLSGLFTQIKREGCGLYPQQLFCFVHLSIQEFVAALYVSHRLTNNGENVFTPSTGDSDSPTSDFYKKAVDKALESKNGDWDLFLRFLLGLSLDTHQNLLQELLKTPQNNQKTCQETVEHIKKKIREISDSEKNLNLFHCLNELNDDSLVEEVKKSLETQNFENFSPSQWSALTFVLLTSDANLEVFDLKNYVKSETVLLGMLPVVKVSETTLLSWCDLTEKSCSGLTTSVLSAALSNLMVLDMSYNDLMDAGVQHLAEGLKSKNCKLKHLKLAGCQVTKKGCSYLASALRENSESHLKELDLSYNHPGESGVTELSALFADPSMKLCVDYAGEHRLKPGIKKFDALLKFDENTMSRRLVLLDEAKNRKVKTVESVKEKVARPENEARFKRTQVCCEEGLEDFGYWEVEWDGMVGIAVAYNEVGRNWDTDGGLGCNEKSWSLLCSRSGFMGRDGKMFTGFIARHGKDSTHIHMPCFQKIAVYLDWKAGTLSYYGASSDQLTLIHTFKEQFTAPLFPGFWFKEGSVTLCDIV